MEEFHEEQKQYLQGFLSGADLGRGLRGLPTFAGTLGLADGAHANGKPGGREEDMPAGPDDVHWQAQNRAVAEGKKLCPEEVAKRKRFPLDMWDDLVRHSAEGRFPKGTDVLAFKYQGLFYVAPAQNAYMCPLAHAGRHRSTSSQFRGVARHRGGVRRRLQPT